MSKEENPDMFHNESKSSSIDSPSYFTPPPPTGFIERTLKPKYYIPRYPKWMVGKTLLWATCFFGSLGDALFGYDQGIMSGLLVNEVFIKRFYSEHGGAEGFTDNVNPSLIGESCLSLLLTEAKLIYKPRYYGFLSTTFRCHWFTHRWVPW